MPTLAERPPRRNDEADGEAPRAGEPAAPDTAMGVGFARGMGLAAAAAATCAMVGVGVDVVAGTLMVRFGCCRPLLVFEEVCCEEKRREETRGGICGREYVRAIDWGLAG